VRSLGRFAPSELDLAAIERELPAHLPGCCRSGRIGVRVPQGAPAHPGNLAWHQDQDVAHLIVWATEMPTELQLPDGTVILPPAGDLMWVDNRRVFHRQPSGTDETRRWFLAVRCGG
jgi:hypothetical protein